MSDLWLQLLFTGVMTGFWLWFLTWEYEHYREGRRQKHWWNADLIKLIKGRK